MDSAQPCGLNGRQRTDANGCTKSTSWGSLVRAQYRPPTKPRLGGVYPVRWPRRVERNAGFDREGTMSMASSRPEMDTSLGFGRGSAVREYWLKRCQGFSAVRADGSRLGRVKRVETQMEGTFLRLTGLRARTLPLSAIETVCPGASLLVISDEHVDLGSELSVGSDAGGRAFRLDRRHGSMVGTRRRREGSWN